MKRYRGVIVLTGVVIAVQLATALFDVSYYLTQLTMSAYYALVAIGLCLLLGFAGQVSLGQAGFFAIGGYTSAVLTTTNLAPHAEASFVRFLAKLGLVLSRTDAYGNELQYLNPWIAFLLAIVLVVGIAVLVGRPVLALRGHYLAMATLGFGTIIHRIVLGTPLFGEADGISSVPGFDLLPFLSVSGSMSARIENYYIAWGVVLIGMLILINLLNSRAGRALRALHGGEAAAEAMGVDTAKVKVRVFVIGALFAAVAGVLTTHYNGGIGPSEAGAAKSVRYLAIVAVGGMANLWGTLSISVLLNFLSLRGVFGSYDDAVFGAILVGVMLFAPDGFLTIPGVAEARRGVTSLMQRGFLRLRKPGAGPEAGPDKENPLVRDTGRRR